MWFHQIRKASFLLGTLTMITPAYAGEDVIAKLQALIEDNYVMKGKVPSIVEMLSAQKTLPIESKEAFAEQLTKALQQFDLHFAVQVSPIQTLTNADSTSVKLLAESWFEKLERQNFGFNDIKILDGNIGYLSFWGFADLTAAAKNKVETVISVLSDVDALIIDLRENGGGSAEMVSYLSSYFLEGKVHLNSFYYRPSNSTQNFWTDAAISHGDYSQLPLYILIGEKTFSAAEEFAYNFKHLDRAMILGGTSKGGANPWQWFSLSKEFRVAIPIAMAVNPITNTNWEGVGVVPHCTSNAGTVELAHSLALQTLKALAPNNAKFNLQEHLVNVPENMMSQVRQCLQSFNSQ